MTKIEADLPNALTVDVEDWYHSVLQIAPDQWGDCEDRVVGATERLLACLAEQNARGTFFVLGHVAEKHPELVPRIAAAGHEIACHGYAHRLAYKLTPDAFRDDLRRALGILRGQTDQPIRGFRAAYWSITRQCLWALDILAEEGLTYDSSIYPTSTGLYGIPEAPVGPFRLMTSSGRELLEFPPTVLPMPIRNIPFAGGIYLRLLPYPVVRWATAKVMQSGRPTVVYIHPPEFDPGKPRLPLPLFHRVLHYARLDAMMEKVPRLLGDFPFAPLAEIIERMNAQGKIGAWNPAAAR